MTKVGRINIVLENTVMHPLPPMSMECFWFSFPIGIEVHTCARSPAKLHVPDAVFICSSKDPTSNMAAASRAAYLSQQWFPVTSFSGPTTFLARLCDN